MNEFVMISKVRKWKDWKMNPPTLRLKTTGKLNIWKRYIFNRENNGQVLTKPQVFPPNTIIHCPLFFPLSRSSLSPLCWVQPLWLGSLPPTSSFSHSPLFLLSLFLTAMKAARLPAVCVAKYSFHTVTHTHTDTLVHAHSHTPIPSQAASIQI